MELTDPTTVIGIVTVLGALAGTVVPYVLKVWKDPEITFDANYAYALVLGVIVQVVALLPDNVPALTLKSVVAAFAAGFGLQTLINKATPKGEQK